MIDRGYYLFFDVETHYIPDYGRGENGFYTHQPFVCGYDLDKEKLYFYDFLGGHYSLGEASFQQMEEGFRNVDFTKENLTYRQVYCYRVTEKNRQFCTRCFSEEFNPSYFGRLFQYHLHETRLDPNDRIAFGIDGYDYYIEHIQKILSGELTYMVHHPFHMLYNHRNMWHEFCIRAEYNGWIREDVRAELLEHVRQAQTMTNKMLKYNLTQSARVAESLLADIHRSRDREAGIVGEIISQLDHTARADNRPLYINPQDTILNMAGELGK